MTKKTILTIICMYCKTKMGKKDGQGAEGNTHSICKKCWADLFPSIPYPKEVK